MGKAGRQSIRTNSSDGAALDLLPPAKPGVAGDLRDPPSGQFGTPVAVGSQLLKPPCLNKCEEMSVMCVFYHLLNGDRCVSFDASKRSAMDQQHLKTLNPKALHVDE